MSRCLWISIECLDAAYRIDTLRKDQEKLLNSNVDGIATDNDSVRIIGPVEGSRSTLVFSQPCGAFARVSDAADAVCDVLFQGGAWNKIDFGREDGTVVHDWLIAQTAVFS